MCRYPRGLEHKDKATARYEHYLAQMMSLRSGMRVLDVDCGVGGPAKKLAIFANCQIVGLNNNGYQVRKARELAEKERVEKLVEFVKGDFMVKTTLLFWDFTNMQRKRIFHLRIASSTPHSRSKPQSTPLLYQASTHKSTACSDQAPYLACMNGC